MKKYNLNIIIRLFIVMLLFINLAKAAVDDAPLISPAGENINYGAVIPPAGAAPQVPPPPAAQVMVDNCIECCRAAGQAITNCCSLSHQAHTNCNRSSEQTCLNYCGSYGQECYRANCIECCTCEQDRGCCRNRCGAINCAGEALLCTCVAGSIVAIGAAATPLLNLCGADLAVDQLCCQNPPVDY